MWIGRAVDILNVYGESKCLWQAMYRTSKYATDRLALESSPWS